MTVSYQVAGRLSVAEAIGTSGLEPREARLLLAEAAGFSQASVIAFPERPLSREAEERFASFAERRRRGEPVAYIVGHKEFYGLDLAVTPAVLIPRPETELLVELALEAQFCSAADLGTGSGAIALALKRQRPAARVVGVDSSAAALALARHNAVKHGLEIELRHGRWLAPLAGERFDLVVSNPPYVSLGDPHLAALSHEPAQALEGGRDGLEHLRQIVGDAVGHLNPGGRLLLEHGLGQDTEVRRLLGRAGLQSVRTWPDLAGIPRVTGGKA